MTKEETIKSLHEALDSLDITFPYRCTLVNAIEHLSIPEPQGLEKAAEEYAKSVLSKKYAILRVDIADAFKSGAKWMAEQGYSQETYVYYNRFNDETEAVIHLGRDGERGGFQPGDRVIVQIRKKEE